jgi:hypothetical protein
MKQYKKEKVILAYSFGGFSSLLVSLVAFGPTMW